GLAGTYVPNPLKKEEKKKVYSRFAIGAIIIAALVAIGIKTELLTINSFTYVVSFLAVTIPAAYFIVMRSEEHTSELQSRFDIVCRLLLEKKNEIVKYVECVT